MKKRKKKPETNAEQGERLMRMALAKIEQELPRSKGYPLAQLTTALLRVHKELSRSQPLPQKHEVEISFNPLGDNDALEDGK